MDQVFSAKTPKRGAYDNSYLIADRDDAWVLETSGREWVARQIRTGIYAISNEPSIREDYDLSSAGLHDTAVSRGWITPGKPFDYAASTPTPRTPLQVSHIRQRRSQDLLEAARARGGVDLASAMGILRDHFEGTFLGAPYFNPARPDFLTLCMHEHAAGFTCGNTAGSMIVDMGTGPQDLTEIWWTPLPPCIGAYVPIFLQSQQLPHGLQIPAPTPDVQPPEECEQSSFNPESYCWRFQSLLDAVKGDSAGTSFTTRHPAVRARFDQLEAHWAGDVTALRYAWKQSDTVGRGRLTQELRSLTERAVREVVAVVAAFILEYAPEEEQRRLITVGPKVDPQARDRPACTFVGN